MLRAEATPETTTDAQTKARLTFGTWESCISIEIGNGEEDDVRNIQVSLGPRPMGAGDDVADAESKMAIHGNLKAAVVRYRAET